ncbi:hypothetical protein PL321_13005 [Caloramator sp. mosi_1]|nr:hypothetical protein [Caloramator sp. mosi_1]WDC83578.1 hypothetical protein PL321_13005 [Caloramator sp. mosi_1]
MKLNILTKKITSIAIATAISVSVISTSLLENYNKVEASQPRKAKML